MDYQSFRPPLNDQAPAAPAIGSYSVAIATIAWAVILACVAIVAVLNWRASKMPARIEATEDVQLLITSRSVVGLYHLHSQSNAMASAMATQTIANLSQNAGPRQQLLLVSVIGELQGAKAANEALDRIAPKLTDPADRADLATLRTIYTKGQSAVPPEQRTALIAHEHWFGRLALSFGQPDSDPLRARVLHEAKKAAVAGISFESLIVFALIGGLALLITAIILKATGRLHLCYGRAPWRTTFYLEAFALYLAGYFSIGFLARKIVPGSLLLGPILAMAWVIFAMLWPLLRGMTWQGLCGALGWYRGQGVVREAFAGIIGYLAGLPIVALSAVFAYVLSSRTHTMTTHPLVFSNTHGAWAIIEMYLLASVFAPLVEETMFRGALFNHLRQRHGWFLSALVSSLLFAALHPQGWTAIPVLGAIGFVLASIREWRGTFIASATAHALNNGVVTTFIILALQ